MNTVFLLTGSNLGNRAENLGKTLDLLNLSTGIILDESAIYETQAWGVNDQPDFLNQVLKLRTILNPFDLLTHIERIEEEIGRSETFRGGPREIDIDILLFNDLIVEKEGICIPHIHLHNRKFVLIPLNEIAPSFTHPKYNKTIGELLSECKDIDKVEEYAV